MKTTSNESSAAPASVAAASSTRSSTRSIRPARSRFARAAADRSASTSTETTRGRRFRQPDRRDAVRRPELEDVARADRAYQHVQQRTGLGLDVAQPQQAVLEAGVVLGAAAVELVEQASEMGVSMPWSTCYLA